MGRTYCLNFAVGCDVWPPLDGDLWRWLRPPFLVSEVSATMGTVPPYDSKILRMIFCDVLCAHKNYTTGDPDNCNSNSGYNKDEDTLISCFD